MALADRATEILDGLPRSWESARLKVALEDPGQVRRATQILGPTTPGRVGDDFSIDVRRTADSIGANPELLRRCLDRLEEDGIGARLTLISHEAEAPEEPAAPTASESQPLAAQWDVLVRELPPSWSDLYLDLELDSSDFIERGALLLSPVNPSLLRDPAGIRFRVAQRFGYGAAPTMARRSLERLDEEQITGRLRVVRVLSDTRPVDTQGPVFRLGGRSV